MEKTHSLYSYLLGTTINPRNETFVPVVLETPFSIERYWVARESPASRIPPEQVTYPGNFFVSDGLRIPSSTQTGQGCPGRRDPATSGQMQKEFFMETPFPHLEAPHNLALGSTLCLHRPSSTDQWEPQGHQIA